MESLDFGWSKLFLKLELSFNVSKSAEGMVSIFSSEDFFSFLLFFFDFSLSMFSVFFEDLCLDFVFFSFLSTASEFSISGFDVESQKSRSSLALFYWKQSCC